MKSRTLKTDDPKAHAANIEQMLTEVIDHMRNDIDRVDDPKAQVLFETSAEVLQGLHTAFTHYEQGTEPGMRR